MVMFASKRKKKLWFSFYLGDLICLVGDCGDELQCMKKSERRNQLDIVLPRYD